MNRLTKMVTRQIRQFQMITSVNNISFDWIKWDLLFKIFPNLKHVCHDTNVGNDWVYETILNDMQYKTFRLMLICGIKDIIEQLGTWRESR